MVQNHVAQGIDLLNRVSVILPHLAELGEVVGDEGGRQLVGPEIHIPAGVYVYAALSDLLPFHDEMLGACSAHGDVVDNRRHSVLEGRSARLLGAVVGEGEVEAIGLAGDEELLRVVPPYERERRQCRDIIEEGAGAKEAQECEAEEACEQSPVRAMDARRLDYSAHATCSWLEDGNSVERKKRARKMTAEAQRCLELSSRPQRSAKGGQVGNTAIKQERSSHWGDEGTYTTPQVGPGARDDSQTKRQGIEIGLKRDEKDGVVPCGCQQANLILCKLPWSPSYSKLCCERFNVTLVSSLGMFACSCIPATPSGGRRGRSSSVLTPVLLSLLASRQKGVGAR